MISDRLKAEDELYKICFIGNCGVGKTAIINRIVNRTFQACYEPTLEMTHYSCEFDYYDQSMSHRCVKLLLEDT